VPATVENKVKHAVQTRVCEVLQYWKTTGQIVNVETAASIVSPTAHTNMLDNIEVINQQQGKKMLNHEKLMKLELGTIKEISKKIMFGAFLEMRKAQTATVVYTTQQVMLGQADVPDSKHSSMNTNDTTEEEDNDDTTSSASPSSSSPSTPETSSSKFPTIGRKLLSKVKKDKKNKDKTTPEKEKEKEKDKDKEKEKDKGSDSPGPSPRNRRLSVSAMPQAVLGAFAKVRSLYIYNAQRTHEMISFLSPSKQTIRCPF
jgi:hypothetical protein